MNGDNVKSLLAAQSAEIKRLQEEHRYTCEMAARTILHALDCKDHYTFGHSLRVTFYSLLIGHELNLSSSDLYDLELACLFHDIGKISIPDSILLKPGRLTDDEFAVIKTHPVKSVEILSDFKDFDRICTFIKHHHESWNGRGYPDGLQGENIPYFSRIMILADTFDAMTSSRPYRQGLPPEKAIAEIKRCTGSQFDPALAEVFLTALAKDTSRREDTFFLKIIPGEFKKDAA